MRRAQISGYGFPLTRLGCRQQKENWKLTNLKCQIKRRREQKDCNKLTALIPLPGDPSIHACGHAAQIRSGHWRSAVYLKRIRRRVDDRCWFCNGTVRMTRSHVLLHCPNERLRAARMEAWEGKDPGVQVLLANPRWERRFVKFLELSGGQENDGRWDR
jgi:hypothetical protein